MLAPNNNRGNQSASTLFVPDVYTAESINSKDGGVVCIDQTSTAVTTMATVMVTTTAMATATTTTIKQQSTKSNSERNSGGGDGDDDGNKEGDSGQRQRRRQHVNCGNIDGHDGDGCRFLGANRIIEKANCQI